MVKRVTRLLRYLAPRLLGAAAIVALAWLAYYRPHQAARQQTAKDGAYAAAVLNRSDALQSAVHDLQQDLASQPQPQTGQNHVQAQNLMRQAAAIKPVPLPAVPHGLWTAGTPYDRRAAMASTQQLSSCKTLLNYEGAMQEALANLLAYDPSAEPADSTLLSASLDIAATGLQTTQQRLQAVPSYPDTWHAAVQQLVTQTQAAVQTYAAQPDQAGRQQYIAAIQSVQQQLAANRQQFMEQTAQPLLATLQTDQQSVAGYATKLQAAY